MDILGITQSENREHKNEENLDSEDILKQTSELNKQKLTQLSWQLLDNYFDGKIVQFDIEQLIAINRVLSSFIYTYLPNRYMYHSCYSTHMLRVLARISKFNLLIAVSVNDILAYARRVALFKCGLSSNDKTVVRSLHQTIDPEVQKLFQNACKEFYNMMRELYTGYNQHDHWFFCLMLDDTTIREIIQKYKQARDVQAKTEKLKSKKSNKTKSKKPGKRSK